MCSDPRGHISASRFQRRELAYSSRPFWLGEDVAGFYIRKGPLRIPVSEGFGACRRTIVGGAYSRVIAPGDPYKEIGISPEPVVVRTIPPRVFIVGIEAFADQ